jgi:hypothetical protein
MIAIRQKHHAAPPPAAYLTSLVPAPPA